MNTVSTDDEKLHIPKWYAVHIKCHHERKVATLLEGKGIELFLPTRRVKSQWKDRKKLIDFPLFPGYLFVHIPLLEKKKVIQTPSVVKIVGTREPQPLPDGEIDAVRRFMEVDIQFDPYPYLIPGKPVEVIRGPLKGVIGILAERRGQHRLVINVELINNSLATEIDAMDVQPV